MEIRASVFVGASVDGFIARANHELDFLPGRSSAAQARARGVPLDTYLQVVIEQDVSPGRHQHSVALRGAIQ